MACSMLSITIDLLLLLRSKFEIKNAPAGDFRLYIWHEETGWLNKGGRDGRPITIKAGETKVLADVDVKYP